MATETGTATGIIDLYTKLISFATTGLGSENWTQVYGYEMSDETIAPTPAITVSEARENLIILRGAGAGAEQIYVALNTWHQIGTAIYNITATGMASFDNTKVFDQQAFKSQSCTSYYWDQSMQYWFVGSARRIIAVAKVGSVYSILYFGFMLPYATPSEYPYPLLVGGMGYDTTIKYDNQGGNNSVFFNGRAGSGSLYLPSNFWHITGNFDTGGSYNDSRDTPLIYYHPWSAGLDGAPVIARVMTALDGCYVLTPVEMVAIGEAGFDGILGALDGIFQVSGFNNYSGNVVDIDGVDYICFQNAHRTGLPDFYALRWE